jgi:protein SCO1/2
LPLYALVGALALLLAWMLFVWQPQLEPTSPHQTMALARPPQGGDFVLTSAAGPVALEDFRGKVVLIYFGYTWCPDVCPTNLGYISLGLKLLTAAERARVQVLFVSVDPERDDPQRLQEYTDFFDGDFIGVTGSPEQIAAVAGQYGAAYRRTELPDSQVGYLVDHSAVTYVVDPRGRLHSTLDHATAPEQIAAAIRRQL